MKRPWLSVALLLAWVGPGCAEPQRPPAKEDADLPEDMRKFVREADRKAEELGRLDNVDFHKAAYKFANGPPSEGGLNLTSTAAREFADSMADLSPAARGKALA